MPRKSRRAILWVVVLIVLATVGVIAVRKFNRPKKPIIKTATVERGAITASVSGNGVLQAWTTMEVKSNVGGQVVELAVDEGDVVRAGQLVAKIDPSDSMANLRQAKADLTSAEAKIAQAQQSRVMTDAQVTANIRAAEESVASARQRVLQAQQQADVQPRLTQAAIDQAESSRDGARAALVQLQTALIPQRLASAQAAYDQAQANTIQAHSHLQRQRALLEKGYVPRSQVETAEQQYATARAQLETATRKVETVKAETEEDVRAAEAKVKQADASLATATANRAQDALKRQELSASRAALKQAEANLASTRAGTYQRTMKDEEVIQANAQAERSRAAMENAETQVGYTTILAPNAGVVVKKYVEPGSIVVAGRSSFSGTGAGVALVEIADITRMQVTVNVDETDIGQIAIGQRVDIDVDAYPEDAFHGTVTKIAPKAIVEQNVTSVPVTVEIVRPDRRLKPGMNATCDFIISRKRDVLLVPTAALEETKRGMTVKVLKGETPVTRTVQVGLESDEQTEILEGVREGEQVVTAVIDPMPKGVGAAGGQNGQDNSRAMRRTMRGGMRGGGPPRGMH